MPVMPVCSLREPTRYQTPKLTTGALRTSFVRTRSPLGRRVSVTPAVSAGAGAGEAPGRRRASRRRAPGGGRGGSGRSRVALASTSPSIDRTSLIRPLSFVPPRGVDERRTADPATPLSASGHRRRPSRRWRGARRGGVRPALADHRTHWPRAHASSRSAGKRARAASDRGPPPRRQRRVRDRPTAWPRGRSDRSRGGCLAAGSRERDASRGPRKSRSSRATRA